MSSTDSASATSSCDAPASGRALGIIAGNGRYPILLAEAARRNGVEKIVVCAFKNETRPEMADLADIHAELRVGQLGKMCSFFQKNGITEVIMAGQIAPSNLFELRPDMRALMMLATLRERNAESIFAAIARELAKFDVHLLPATTHLEDCLPEPGLIAGPKLKKRQEMDIEFGLRIAKASSALDIGQTVIVKKGTVVAVEAFEGTDAAIRRGGELSKGGATLVKVSKPNQDFRFDVPVIGPQTLETAREAGLSVVACEAKKTLLLDKDELMQLAARYKISLAAAAPHASLGAPSPLAEA